MAKVRILLAEDDPNLGSLLAEFLELKGDFKVTLCQDGEEAWGVFNEQKFDIIILDIMMPEKDGLTLGRDIRAVNKFVPIIYVSAKGLIQDKAAAFKLGADDYLSKPFSVEELLLRINAILRRVSPEAIDTNSFVLGSFVFDYTSRKLTREGEDIKLSTKESELLKMLCLYKNQLMPRPEALRKIWKEENFFTSRSMDVYISKLRKILAVDPTVEIINIHGAGCRLVVPE